MKKHKNKSNSSWISAQIHDRYVKDASIAGYRSRAAYKLLQIHESKKLFANPATVVDLGSAPGSWLQVIKKTYQNPLIIGVDIVEIKQLHGVSLIQGNFCHDSTLEAIQKINNHQKIDLLLSDMSPSLSGVKDVDQANSLELVIHALEFAKSQLSKNGTCLIKVFYGTEFTNINNIAKNIFQSVEIIKPIASRSESKESYMLCKKLKN